MTTSNLIPHWCKKMRWKSYGMDKEDTRLVVDTFETGHVTYSCLHTAEPFGPDDGLAAPERCHSKRTCYEEHPNLQTLVNIT